CCLFEVSKIERQRLILNHATIQGSVHVLSRRRKFRILIFEILCHVDVVVLLRAVLVARERRETPGEFLHSIIIRWQQLMSCWRWLLGGYSMFIIGHRLRMPS